MNIDSSLLNRQQTAEWRGWMQISFLIYHYLGAGQVPLPLYIWIRMMVASFMFMTGFGHTTYFLIKKNYNVSLLQTKVIELYHNCVVSLITFSNFF